MRQANGTPLIKWIGLGLLTGFLAAGLSFKLVGKTASVPSAPTPSVPPVKASVQKQVSDEYLLFRYKTITLPTAIAHVAWVPMGPSYTITAFSSTTFVNPKPALVTQIAKSQEAVVALNAGFFDPANGKTTSYLITNDQVIEDPQQNERLTQNPALSPYLPKIFNRSEFRVLWCPNQNNYLYDIALRQTPVEPGCRIESGIGGGPQLLPTFTPTEEGFYDQTPAGKVLRDPIGINRLDARSAIGITAQGHVLLVMIAQDPKRSDAKGLSLPQLAEFLKQQGAVKAMALDGGSSSSMAVMKDIMHGQRQPVGHFGKLNDKNQPIQRPVKTVLLVQEAGC